VNILLTAALAAIAGVAWNWATDNQPMTYWLMGVLIVGSSLAAELLEQTWRWSRARRRPGRRAHARPTPKTRKTA
jgi:uncharacterized membrane protein